MTTSSSERPKLGRSGDTLGRAPDEASTIPEVAGSSPASWNPPAPRVLTAEGTSEWVKGWYAKNPDEVPHEQSLYGNLWRSHEALRAERDGLKGSIAALRCDNQVSLRHAREFEGLLRKEIAVNEVLRARVIALEGQAARKAEEALKYALQIDALKTTLTDYACDSSEHPWGNDEHPCFGYKSCRTLMRFAAVPKEGEA